MEDTKCPICNREIVEFEVFDENTIGRAYCNSCDVYGPAVFTEQDTSENAKWHSTAMNEFMITMIDSIHYKRLAAIAMIAQTHQGCVDGESLEEAIEEMRIVAMGENEKL